MNQASSHSPSSFRCSFHRGLTTALDFPHCLNHNPQSNGPPGFYARPSHPVTHQNPAKKSKPILLLIPATGTGYDATANFLAKCDTIYFPDSQRPPSPP